MTLMTARSLSLLLLLLLGRHLLRSLQNILRGNNHRREIIRLETEHSHTTAVGFYGAHDENSERLAIDREDRGAQRRRSHPARGHIKQAGTFHDCGDAVNRRGVSPAGAVAETIQ